MMLARPEYLWALAAVPVAGLGLLLEARRRRQCPAPGLRHRLHAVCLLAGIFLVALAAAGPELGREPPAPARGPGRLMVALDCSKSMLARDLVPDRLEAAKGLIRDVLARLPELPAGLVIFGGRARLACPVTADRAAWLAFLQAATPADVPLGGTSLTTALEASRLALLGGEPGVVLLVSDGEDTSSVAPDLPSGQGPPVVTVAVGGSLPVPLPDRGKASPVQVGVDVATLAALAGNSGGHPFRLSPENPRPGAAVAAAVAGLVPTGPGQPAPVRPADRTLACLAAGLVLLGLDFLLTPVSLTGLAVVWLLAAGPARPSTALAGTSAATAVASGLTAQRQGRFEAARDAFLAARARDPDAPVILFDLGTAYYRLGRYDLARAAFDRAARAGTGPLRARALYNQGNAAFRQGDVAAAAALYQDVLGLDPTDAQARANLAFVRAQAPAPASPPAPPRPQQTPSAAPASDPSAPETARAEQPGQAPPALGPDPHREAPARPAAAPVTQLPAGSAPPANTQAGSLPLTGQDGMAGGSRRTQPDAVTPDRLDTVPDRPGLPLFDPGQPRPGLEKDW